MSTLDKNEYRVKTEQMLEYMKQKSYKKAMEIADSLDWNKVKNVPVLCTVSEIYEYNKEYEKSRDVLFMAYDRAPESRKIVYRLGTLALKLDDLKEAKDCYQEFMALAPKDPNGYIFKYKLLKYQKAPLEQQIEVLEEFKKIEYVEKWVYELAQLYHEAGMTAECLEECDDLILWFSEGRYVLMAMELKMKYKPLTPLQQEKYMLQVNKKAQKAAAESEPQQENEEITQPVEEIVEIEEAVETVEEETPADGIREPEKTDESEEIEEVEKPEVAAEEKKQQTSGLSIEDILHSWEETQKENAQIIMAEHERVQIEKERQEAEKPEEQNETDILPDDVKQLMEELEAESAEIAAQKTVPEDAGEVVESAAEVSETAPVMKESEAIEEMKAVEEIEDPSKDYGIKLGDTQSITISAKALKNDRIMEVPEEKPIQKTVTSKFDTGFIVQGRYDLEAQSEIGLKAGLTEEQKQLFSYFVPVHGMSEQIVDVLQKDKSCRARYGTSRIGNLIIVGRKGTGKTVLAVNFVKAIQKSRKLKQGKVGIVTAESLNKKDVSNIMEKLHGGALVIERASKMNRKTVTKLSELMEEQTGEMFVILEDERKPLDKMLSVHPNFSKKFTSRIELPVFINDELVTFGQTYAKENGYKIDDMGILALYSRIDVLQREESVVTVADIKNLIDEAIENSKKVDMKNFMKRIFKKNTDDLERVILTEKDFKA